MLTNFCFSPFHRACCHIHSIKKPTYALTSKTLFYIKTLKLVKNVRKRRHYKKPYMFRSHSMTIFRGRPSSLAHLPPFSCPLRHLSFFGFVAVCPLFVCVPGVPVCVLSVFWSKCISWFFNRVKDYCLLGYDTMLPGANLHMFHYCFHHQVGRWWHMFVKFWQISTTQHGITPQAEVIVMTTVRNSYIIMVNKILITTNLWPNKLPRLSLLYTRHGTMKSWRKYEQLRMSFRCRFA
jgi:hypothetical protein